MNMRKRRKHVAGIPGRDAFTRAVWANGMLLKFVAFNRRWLRLIPWNDPWNDQ